MSTTAIFKPVCQEVDSHGRPQTFFSRGVQDFPGGGGKNILFALKNAQKHTICFQKVKKHNILAGAPSCPPLRTPMLTVQ